MNHMKKSIYIFLVLFAGSSVLSGCKKFLNVTPVDNLSGNNYWQNKKDVEAFTGGIYNKFRIATTSSAYFPAVGDMRCSPLIQTSGNGRSYISDLAGNNMRGLMKNGWWTGSYFNFVNFTKWNVWYEMIQSANILFVQVDKVPDPAFSAADKAKYRAEAVFLRNLAYLFLVRQFGDVPYYTNAYNEKPLPRMDMVEVLNRGLEDMGKYKNDLPWTYEDPSIVAIRAMRGGAIDLMMHMHMWAAGFDPANKTAHYTAVNALGDELMNQNNNSYELLPLERTKEIFKGRTREGLFEVLQSLNYGERFDITAAFSDMVLRYPNKQPASNSKSYTYYQSKYLDILYPAGKPDKRKDYWFDEFMYATDGKFQLLKFVNIFAQEGEDVNPDDNMIVFRLADAILLRAEAQAELGLNADARTTVNIIRQRAGADPITESDEDLKDAIFYERNRELMGEGHAYFDLVRTKRVLRDKYCFHPIGVEDFNNGAWTWPIDQSAMNRNPYMTLNDFWR